MGLEDLWKDELERRDNFFKEMGNLIGYTGENCVNCGRCRVEKWSSGLKICDKCGTDQKTGEHYSNQYGCASEFYI